MNSNVQLKKDQIYIKLRQLIETGVFAAGSKLPSEVVLAEQLKVSRITLRAAMKQLKIDGYINQTRGRGTFVAAGATAESKSNGTIMVIHNATSGIEESWRYITPAISTLAQQRNYEITITTTEALEMFSSKDIKKSIITDNIIGIIAIMSSFSGNEPILPKMQATKLPVVIAHANANDSDITGFASIVSDIKKSWEVAISHLSEQGFKRVAVLGLKTARSPFRQNSQAETLRLIRENGMISDDSLIEKVRMDYRETKAAIEKFMTRPQPPDVILCYSDFLAVHVYHALEKLGLKIPDDIAVMGICGYPDAKRLTPSLSTIDFEYTKIAQMAFEMIIEPEHWYDPETGQGKLRAKQFKLQARQSTKKQLIKEVAIDRTYHFSQSENVAFA
jgi:DNA-binding LacI/PurR family transcriptional regulator